MSLSRIIAVFILVVCVASPAARAQATSSHVSEPDKLHSNTSDGEPSKVVIISPTTLGPHSTQISGAEDFHHLQGFDLRSLLAHVYGVSAARIVLPQSIDASSRYDVAVSAGRALSEAAMNTLLCEAIEERFHLIAARVSRSTDVYVVSALGDPPASSRVTTSSADSNADTDTVRSSSVGFRVVSASAEAATSVHPGIGEMNEGSIQGATLDEFCQTLENDLDRPVVNETHLQGMFKFHLKSTSDTQNDLLEQLQSIMKMIVQPSTRIVERVVFQVH